MRAAVMGENYSIAKIYDVGTGFKVKVATEVYNDEAPESTAM